MRTGIQGLPSPDPTQLLAPDIHSADEQTFCVSFAWHLPTISGWGLAISVRPLPYDASGSDLIAIVPNAVIRKGRVQVPDALILRLLFGPRMFLQSSDLSPACHAIRSRIQGIANPIDTAYHGSKATARPTPVTPWRVRVRRLHKNKRR